MTATPHEPEPHDELGLLRQLDAVLAGRALVYGSLPPYGRDLDLVVRADDAATLAAVLAAEGFSRSRGRWIRFRGCSVGIVELLPPARLAVARAEQDAVFAAATPLAGLSSIVEPAPHHTLLILARRVARERALPRKHRERIGRALARDPGAWDRAATRAAAWAAADALAHLRSLHEAPRERQLPTVLARRPRRTLALAVSGPSGSRVEFHAGALRDTLDRLGVDALVVEGARSFWSQMTADEGARARLVGARALGLSAAAAFALRLPLWRRLGRGGVVIFERHALDLAAASVAPGATAAAARRRARLLTAFARRPLRTYVLVPAGESTTPYVGGARGPAVRTLDATCPDPELCEAIAADAWRALSRRGAVDRALRRLRTLLRVVLGGRAWKGERP